METNFVEMYRAYRARFNTMSTVLVGTAGACIMLGLALVFSVNMQLAGAVIVAFGIGLFAAALIVAIMIGPIQREGTITSIQDRHDAARTYRRWTGERANLEALPYS